MHANPMIIPRREKAPCVATQRALNDGAGRVRAIQVFEASRWTKWPSPAPEGITRWDAHSVARCSDCGGGWREHGWTGTHTICLGDWVVRGPDGLVVLRPAAFHAQYEPTEMSDLL